MDFYYCFSPEHCSVYLGCLDNALKRSESENLTRQQEAPLIALGRLPAVHTTQPVSKPSGKGLLDNTCIEWLRQKFSSLLMWV